MVRLRWVRGQDLNLRPSGYEPDELPGCSTPRRWCVCAGPAWRPGGDRLSRSLGCSTMGAGAFHGRVRDGIGCCVPAMATGPPGRILWWLVGAIGIGCGARAGVCAPATGLRARGGRRRRRRSVFVSSGGGGWLVARRLGPGCSGRSSFGRLGPLGCAHRCASTCGLSTCWSGTALGETWFGGGFPA